MAMQQYQIGILYPGAMGISLAASAQRSGHVVAYPSVGRSAATHQRASTHGLVDRDTLAAVSTTCQIIISIRPPLKLLL